MKDDSPVGDRAKVENLGGGRYTLTIFSMSAEDFGVYSVSVIYVTGEIKCSATIRRSDMEFKRKLYSQSIDEGDLLHLVIEVSGQPTKVEVRFMLCND